MIVQRCARDAATIFHPQLAQVKHGHRGLDGELIKPVIEIIGYPASDVAIMLRRGADEPHAGLNAPDHVGERAGAGQYGHPGGIRQAARRGRAQCQAQPAAMQLRRHSTNYLLCSPPTKKLSNKYIFAVGTPAVRG